MSGSANFEFYLGEPSKLIRALIRESLNNEIDWQWAADNVQNPVDRAYCLAYVVQTQPYNETAREALENQLALLRGTNVKQPITVTQTQRAIANLTGA